MEQNPIQLRNKKLEELFAKIERVLSENFEVISKMLVPVVRDTEESIL